MLGLANAFSGWVDNVQMLDDLHQRIEQQRVPVQSRDDLASQLIELDRYMGSTVFTDALARVRRGTIMMVLVFLPVAAYMLLMGGGYLLEMLGVGPGGDALIRQSAMVMIDYMWSLIVWSALVVAVIIYCKWLNHKAGQARLALVEAFFEKTEPVPPLGGV